MPVSQTCQQRTLWNPVGDAGKSPGSAASHTRQDQDGFACSCKDPSKAFKKCSSKLGRNTVGASQVLAPSRPKEAARERFFQRGGGVH